MEQGTVTEYSSKDLRTRKGNIYLAKDKSDAQHYIKLNGGLLFHEQGTEIYRVFPDSMKEYNGFVYSMEED